LMVLIVWDEMFVMAAFWRGCLLCAERNLDFL
jgi:hypothetical protein